MTTPMLFQIGQSLEKTKFAQMNLIDFTVMLGAITPIRLQDSVLWTVTIVTRGAISTNVALDIFYHLDFLLANHLHCMRLYPIHTDHTISKSNLLMAFDELKPGHFDDAPKSY
ncbi:hypothetical protein IGF51_001623 [Escherichia coli]|nr:hypothetical protein [Escherichia coli]